MQSTKLQSYNQTKPTSGERAREILAFLVTTSGATRAEIAEATDIALSSVCGRINELLASGEVEVSGTKKDLNSGRQVEIVKIK